MLHAIMNRCQVLVGHIDTADPVSSIPDLLALVTGLPTSLSPSAQVIVGYVLAQTFLRLAIRVGAGRDPDVERAYVAVSIAPAVSPRWCAEATRFLERCLAAASPRALTEPLATPADFAAGVQARKALRFIEDRLSDDGLALHHVAVHLRRSPRHTGRLLKAATQVGFVSHVRRRRVAAAQTLLRTSSLTMKEIATVAGFGDASQFCRAFKHVCGVTPAAYRQASDSTFLPARRSSPV